MRRRHFLYTGRQRWNPRTILDTREVAREVRKRDIQRSEKRVTTVAATINATSSGEANSNLYNLVHGDDEMNNFTGNKITPTGITLRYRVDLGLFSSKNAVRVILLQDIEGEKPGPFNLLSTVGTTSTPFSTYNPDHHGSVRILHDKVYNLDVSSKQNAYPKDKNGNWKTIYIPASKLRRATLTVGSQVYQGDIRIFVYSDVPTGSANYPVVSYYVEVKYVA